MTTLQATTLWRAWREQSDARAFEDLVSDELPYAADLARRCGASAAEADDAVQQALVKLAREASDTPLKVGIRAWICRRVILAFKMHVRASGRRRKHERAAPGPHTAGDPTTPVELRDSVNHALALLPLDLRQAVVLRHLFDLDYGELAHVLGVSRNACRLRVFKGLRRLRHELGGDASALVALVGVPSFVAKVAPAALAKSTAATATGAATASTGGALSGKAISALASAAVATTVGAALLLDPGTPEPMTEPPAVVAVAPPPPSPTPLPIPTPPPPEPVWQTPPVLGLLSAHLAGTRDATQTLWDFGAVDSLLGPARGEVLHITDPREPLDLPALAARTSRIELGAGTYRVSRGLNVQRRGVLEIVGAGPKKTLLQVSASRFVTVHGDLGGLRLRDLTCEAPTTLVIHGRAAATFQRVRFRGWHDYGGFGAPVGFDGTALLAFDACEFVGGYRGRPKGYAVGVRGGGLMLFRDCVFADVAEVVINAHPDAHRPRSLAHFEGCTFEACPLARRSDSSPYPITLRNCVLRFGLTRQMRAKRMAAFGAARAEMGSDSTLLPEPTRCTLAEIRAFLARYRAPAGSRLMAVEIRTHRDAERPFFVAHTENAAKVRTALLYDFTAGQVVALPQGTHRLDARLSLASGEGTTLRRLLEDAWPTLNASEPIGGVAMHKRADNTIALVVLGRNIRIRR